MLESLHRIARRLAGFRWLFLILLGISLVGLVYALLTLTSGEQQLLITTLLGCIWSLLVLAFSAMFRHVPPPPEPGMKWLPRIKRKTKRSLYGLLALFVGGASLMVLGLSAKLLGQLLRA